MAIPRKAARKDDNHDDLVRFWREIGGSWLDLYQLPGALDGLAGIYGLDQRVEVKDGSKPPSRRKLTDDEQREFDTWKGRKPVVWETYEDALATRRALMLEANTLGGWPPSNETESDS